MSVEMPGKQTAFPTQKALQKEFASRFSTGAGSQKLFEQVLQQTQSPVRFQPSLFPFLTSGPHDAASEPLGALLAHKSPESLNTAMSQQRGAVTPARLQHLGTLSAGFESGRAGVAAIGYDTNGGTSYGTYQISSRAGTMERFLDYLETQMPEWAKRLRAAGPANTGSRQGAMPEVWQSIAAEDATRFARLQHDFIEKTHYLPALQEIAQRTGVNLAHSPKATQEVLWSTAVQHGAKGAANIFCTALDAPANRPGTPLTQDFVASIYATRARQFDRSSTEVQAAVQRRFQQEQQTALAMFAHEAATSQGRNEVVG
jgi:hypothetical protein